MTAIVYLTLLLLTGGGDVPPFGFSGLELHKASTGAQNLVTADFDGDGRLDFAFANNERSRIELFLQKSPEELARPRTQPPRYDDVNEIHDDARFRKVLIPLESTVHAMLAADLDGDGRAEVVVRGVPNRLTIWKRQAGDQWAVHQKMKIQQGSAPRRSLAAADLNGDGRLDVALLEKEGIQLYLQGEAGRLKPPEHFPTGLRDATGIAFARPAEGRPALVLYRLGEEDGLAVRPLLGNALGPEWVFRSGKMERVLVPERIDRLSAFTVMRISDRLHLKTLRTESNEDAVFETPLSLYPIAAERGVRERSVTVGDVNGDGRGDVVVSRPSASTLEVYLQDEDGFFRAPRTSSTFAGTAGVQVGDFDGDGGMSALVVSAEEQVVGVADWEKDRLTFPRRVEGIEDKPHAALAVSLLEAGRMDLAVVTEAKRKYAVLIFPGFSGPPTKVPLEFLKVKPTRLLAVDLDADGDRDLAVITDRDELGLVLNEGGGKFTALGSEAFGGKWLLQDVDAGSYTTTVLPGGRPVILVAKKTIGRAVGLDKNRKLVVLEQISAGENVKLTGIAWSGDEVVVVDEKSASLKVLRRREGEWKRVQEIELPSNIVRSLRAVQLRAEGGTDLIVAEKSGFLILRRGQRETKLVSSWNYESDVKDSKLRLLARGDLNADGRPDLAVTDNEKRALELLVPPAEAGGKVTRGLRFEIYEEKREYRRSSSYVREMVVADLTGDKKDDLLFLLHDRVVLYPQE